MSYSIFIGYVGTSDKKIAKICERRFSVCGLSPILSEETYDDEVRGKIIAQLKAADVFVAIHSARSLDSAWLHQEIGFFLGRHGGGSKKIHILARSPKHAKDARSIALCQSKNYLPIPRMKRERVFSENRPWGKGNQDTLESALDMLVSKLISEGVLQVKTACNEQFGEHRLMRLHSDFQCCGPQDLELPCRVYHGGWVLRFLKSPTCRRCGIHYNLDPLTWEAVRPSPQPKSDRFLLEEYTLYQDTLSNLERARHSDGGSE